MGNVVEFQAVQKLFGKKSEKSLFLKHIFYKLSDYDLLIFLFSRFRYNNSTKTSFSYERRIGFLHVNILMYHMTHHIV